MCVQSTIIATPAFQFKIPGPTTIGKSFCWYAGAFSFLCGVSYGSLGLLEKTGFLKKFNNNNEETKHKISFGSELLFRSACTFTIGALFIKCAKKL